MPSNIILKTQSNLDGEEITIEGEPIGYQIRTNSQGKVANQLRVYAKVVNIQSETIDIDGSLVPAKLVDIDDMLEALGWQNPIGERIHALVAKRFAVSETSTEASGVDEIIDDDTMVSNMGKINLLIANANGNFTPTEVATINKAAVDAERFIKKHFTFNYEVDLVITAPSFLMKTIPEDGISGRTYNSRLIIIVLDKNQTAIGEGIVYETICHEMSHSLRWEKLPEYSDNLFKGMVLEGLATVLEEKALEERGIDTPQFYLKTICNTSEAEYTAMIAALQDSFENKNYDYETVFYTGNETLPRWAGYRLGYYYVKKYLEKTGRSIEEATLDSYELFTYK